MEETAAVAALKISAEISKDVLFEIAKLMGKGMYNLAAVSLAAAKTAADNRSGNRGITGLLKGHNPIAAAIKREDYKDFLALCRQYKVPFANVDNPKTPQVEIVIREADLPIFNRIFQRLGMGEFKRVSDVEGRGTLEFGDRGAPAPRRLDMRALFEKAGIGELYDEYAAYIAECNNVPVRAVPEDPTIVAENELTYTPPLSSRQTEPNLPTPQERQARTQNSQEPLRPAATNDIQSERVDALLRDSGIVLPNVTAAEETPAVGTVRIKSRFAGGVVRTFSGKAQMLEYARDGARYGDDVSATVYSKKDTAFIEALSAPPRVGRVSHITNRGNTYTAEFDDQDDMIRYAKLRAETAVKLDASVYLTGAEFTGALRALGANVTVSEAEPPANLRMTVTIEDPPGKNRDVPLYRIEDIGERLDAAQALADAKNAVNAPQIPAPQLEK
jgi:hypothetical protein